MVTFGLRRRFCFAASARRRATTDLITIFYLLRIAALAAYIRIHSLARARSAPSLFLPRNREVSAEPLRFLFPPLRTVTYLSARRLKVARILQVSYRL